MALSPSIPTSFVPKQPVSTGGRRKYSAGNNILLFVSIAILTVAVVASIGTFVYSQYLGSVEKAKSAELVQAQQSADPTTVAQFVRLRNRFTAANQILNQHVTLSNFLVLLGTITLQNVDFNSLAVTVANDRSATISLKGEAKSFNSLADESAAFASQPLIKSAIFSGISPSSTGGKVSFAVDATLDPSLVEEKTAPTNTGSISGGATPTFSSGNSTSSTTTGH